LWEHSHALWSSRIAPESWAYLRPILSQNQGWALFITTPRGKNHAYDMLQAAKSEPNWFTMLSTVADTDAIPIEQQATDLREYLKLYGEIQGRAFFRQEFFVDFDSPILGAVYADALGYLESEGRIKEVRIEPGVDVHTGWDLGIGDATAIWFVQVVGREYRLIGYYESSGAPLGHYIDKVNEFKFKHKVRFGNHYLPHDTRQRELIAGMSRFKTPRSLGIEPEVVPAHNPQDGINAVRRMLDRTIIDPVRCAEGLDLLRNYKYEWQERKRIWSPHPRHDFASHCADALRCFAAGHDPNAPRVGSGRSYSQPVTTPSH